MQSNNHPKSKTKPSKFSIARFVELMKNPKERKFFAAIFGGKLLGLAACFAIIFAISAYFGSGASKAHAQDATAAATNAVSAVTNAMATATNAVTAGTTNAPAAAPTPPPD